MRRGCKERICAPGDASGPLLVDTTSPQSRADPSPAATAVRMCLYASMHACVHKKLVTLVHTWSLRPRRGDHVYAARRSIMPRGADSLLCTAPSSTVPRLSGPRFKTLAATLPPFNRLRCPSIPLNPSQSLSICYDVLVRYTGEQGVSISVIV